MPAVFPLPWFILLVFVSKELSIYRLSAPIWLTWQKRSLKQMDFLMVFFLDLLFTTFPLVSCELMELSSLILLIFVCLWQL